MAQQQDIDAWKARHEADGIWMGDGEKVTYEVKLPTKVIYKKPPPPPPPPPPSGGGVGSGGADGVGGGTAPTDTVRKRFFWPNLSTGRVGLGLVPRTILNRNGWRVVAGRFGSTTTNVLGRRDVIDLKIYTPCGRVVNATRLLTAFRLSFNSGCGNQRPGGSRILAGVQAHGFIYVYIDGGYIYR